VDASSRPADQPPTSWAPPPQAPARFSLGDFVTFRYFVTPGFITAIYIIGVVLFTIGPIVAVPVSGPGASVGGGLLTALVVIVVANLWWRIVLEFVVVLFRINDSLASIERRGHGM
jgi:hypothetical protein